jgi:3-oxoacyl-[acyl-carrier protein] reductase
MARRVVVTGGTAGIGKAVAAHFAAAGGEVVLTGRTAERVERAAAEVGARGRVCDATDPAAVEALADEVGAVDVLVAAAGGLLPGRPADLAAVAAWWEQNLALNLLGTVLTTTALLPRMRAGGAVVAFGSMAAEVAAVPYGAAKAAVQAWVSALSSQVGPRGITANTVSPGTITGTEFFDGLQVPPERAAAALAETHTGRLGTLEDVVGVVAFLAGPHARHLTGQVLHVDGGAFTTR